MPTSFRLPLSLLKLIDVIILDLGLHHHSGNNTAWKCMLRQQMASLQTLAQHKSYYCQMCMQLATSLSHSRVWRARRLRQVVLWLQLHLVLLLMPLGQCPERESAALYLMSVKAINLRTTILPVKCVIDIFRIPPIWRKHCLQFSLKKNSTLLDVFRDCDIE